MANIWNSISRQPSHSRKKEKELVVPGGSIIRDSDFSRSKKGEWDSFFIDMKMRK